MYIIFLLFSFRVHRSTGPERYRVGPVCLPRLDRDRAGLCQCFPGDMSTPHARPSAKRPMLLGEKDDRAESHRNDYSACRDLPR
jgi:hypothetical protein